MGTTKAPDDKITPAAAAQASQSDEPLIEERRTIIAEYASRLTTMTSWAEIETRHSARRNGKRAAVRGKSRRMAYSRAARRVASKACGSGSMAVRKLGSPAETSCE